MRRNLLTILLYIPLAVSLSFETRRSTLLSWNTDTVLGWVQERRDSATISQVTAGWGNNDESLTVDLPYITNVESLASSLWPSALAGAILCQSPAFAAMTNTSILEVGAGLGLAGQVLLQATKASSCQLTDNDKESIKLLQESIEDDRLSARYLEWRDDPDEEERHSIDILLGTDVAYYFYLLRPLMDTAKHLLKPTKSLFVVLGQAYRESLWDLYDNIANGCYNQLTDQHETKWPGKTDMLLYRLEMQKWQKQPGEALIEGTVPIALLLHQSPGLLELDPLTAHDHVATAQDREKLFVSF